MEYKHTIIMEDGKINIQMSGNTEIFGMNIKIKEYKVSGDINKVIENFADMIEGDGKTAGIIIYANIMRLLGINEKAVERLKKLLIDKK